MRQRKRSLKPFIVRRVVGDSMMPSLHPGKLVIARCWFVRARPRHIVVIQHEGKEKIKRITEVQRGQMYVVGDNPAASTDSRHFGWIYSTSVIGKVISVR